MNRHWTDQELLELVYGVRATNSHLTACPSCVQRLEAFEQRRVQLSEVSTIEDAPGAFDAQRRKVLERIRKQATMRPWYQRWPALISAAATLVVAVVMSLPGEKPTTLIAHSDQELFGEIHEMVASAEPQAVTPIHALFEQQSTKETSGNP